MTATPLTTPQVRRRWIVGLAFIAFVSLGLPDGLLGVAWPSVRADFGLELGANKSLFITSTLGYLVSSTFTSRLLERMSVGMLLALSSALTGLALLGYALAPAWSLIVGLGVFVGLGAGAIDTGLNTFAATNFSPRTVNWLHACYGIGATTGPALMTWLLFRGEPWTLAYGLIGATQLALACAFVVSRRLWASAQAPAAPDAADDPTSAPLLATLARGKIWLGIALFFVYTGLEVAVGQWGFTVLTLERGLDETTAGSWISLYWASLTIGRVALGWVAGRMDLTKLLRLSLAGVALGAALLAFDLAPWADLAGLVLIGGLLAPVFPSLVAATPSRVSRAHTTNAVGFQMTAATLGAAFVPALAGILGQEFGIALLAPLFLGLALLLIILHEVVARLGKL